MIHLAAAFEALLVLIEAPVGYGKTVVAERLLAARDATPIRVRLPADGGIDELVAVTRRAVRRAGLGPVADAMAAVDGDDALDHLVGALAERADAVTLLVDDAHHLDTGAATALADAIGDLPPSARAVLCGRDLRAFATLDARAATVRIGPDDLQLDAADIAALLTEPTDALVAELLAATEGWPAAVALATDRLRREPMWSAVTSGGVRALLRALVDDLVAADPSLLVLARLPLHDDEVVAIVRGTRASSPVELPSRRVGPWRVVPNVVREVLEGGPALDDDVLLAVARHYQRAGETAAAIAVLRAEASPATLASFLAGLRWTDLVALDVVELTAAVDAVGPLTTDDAVHAVVHAARAVELTDRVLRTRWLTAAEASADASRPVQRAVAAEVARDRFRTADVDGGVAAAEAVLREAGDDELFTRARALVTIGMAQVFACTPMSLAQASDTYAEAAALFREAGETSLQAETLARLGYTALYIAGRPADGQAVMSEALALLPVGDRARAFWVTFYADLLDFLGKDDEADAAVREAIEIGERRRDPTTSGMAWWTRSWLAGHRGDLPGLHHALAEVERHRGAWLRGGQEAEYLGSSAEHLSLAGDVVGFHEYLGRASALAAELDYPEVVTTPLAYYEAEHGDATTGVRMLEELESSRAIVPSGGPRRWILRAVAHARLGDVGAARRAADEAYRQAAAMGVADLHGRVHRRQVALLESLLGDGVAPDPVGARPAARLQVLGRFSLTVGDDDRTPPVGHPATLVKLLALGRSLTVEGAVDVLWPDADVATGRARLRNLLNRLKERSGPIVVRDGEVLRLDDAVHVDAAAFDVAATAALSAPDDERVGRARHAIALYVGELLPGDVYEEWAALDRARLQRRFVSLADLVAADCIARDDLDEAARLLDLGIAAEPLDDARPLQLCDVLVAQGRTNAARQVAERCIGALAELGVDASPRLLAHARPAEGRRTRVGRRSRMVAGWTRPAPVRALAR